MVSPANLCVVCKGGRNLCGNNPCPLIQKFNVQRSVKGQFKENFFGKSPSIFVGRYGYPNVSVGPMGSLDDNLTNDTAKLFGKNYEEIINERMQILRSKGTENIFSKNRFVEQNQEIALSPKNVDIEMHFKGKPNLDVKFNDVIQPMGPTFSLKKFDLAENISVPRRIESIVNDELPASESSFLIYRSGYSESRVSAILSSGVLGNEKRKKLVPTRWSITATDDILTKKMLKSVREYHEIKDYMVFTSYYMDNRFEVLLMPGSWEYENFEAWAPGTPWSQGAKEAQILVEYEPYEGRTKYADKEGGGYYAARLAVVEYLDKIKKQARVVVFREVYEGYIIPLGVWQVRENTRNAMKGKPKKFSTLKEALDDINSRLRLDMKDYISQSIILRQKSIKDFLRKNRKEEREVGYQ